MKKSLATKNLRPATPDSLPEWARPHASRAAVFQGPDSIVALTDRALLIFGGNGDSLLSLQVSHLAQVEITAQGRGQGQGAMAILEFDQVSLTMTFAYSDDPAPTMTALFELLAL